MSYMPQSKSDTHITPDRVWEMIEEHWGYEKKEFFDPCPVDFKQNGLEIEWEAINFVNPPYTLLKEFVYKAMDEAKKFMTSTIMLLPSKTDQPWFHEIINEGYSDNIIWIKGRLKFKNNKWSATQPHFLVLIE